MKLGLVQYAPEWEAPQASVDSLVRLLDGCDPDFDLFVFPEMTLSGFTMEPGMCAGSNVGFFADFARELGADVLAGVIEEEGGRFFNSLIHWNAKGETACRYKKIHPFSFAGEDQYYSAGSEPVITTVGNTPVALSICYDLRFPELYRTYAKARVPLMVNVANWPAKRSEHWTHLLKARAIENQCYMVGVNRVGDDPLLAYNGHSAVYGPLGNEVVRVEDSERLIAVDIDLAMVEEIRGQMPFLNDIKLI